MFGFADDEIGNNMSEWNARVHPEDIARLLVQIGEFFHKKQDKFAAEYRVRCKDDSWKWILTRGMVAHRDEEGRVTRMIGTHTDLTERKQAEETIRRQAHYDALTQLPNRRLFRDRLEQTIRLSKRDHAPFALMLIDLDHFKEVNDTMGHDAGDFLLVDAAQRILHCVRESDTVARMGGDEFVVILPDIDDPANIERIAQKIIGKTGGTVPAGRRKGVHFRQHRHHALSRRCRQHGDPAEECRSGDVCRQESRTQPHELLHPGLAGECAETHAHGQRPARCFGVQPVPRVLPAHRRTGDRGHPQGRSADALDASQRAAWSVPPNSSRWRKKPA